MKVAHVKTVDGTTIMIQDRDASRFKLWVLTPDICEPFRWKEPSEECILFRQHIISVRFREVAE